MKSLKRSSVFNYGALVDGRLSSVDITHERGGKGKGGLRAGGGGRDCYFYTTLHARRSIEVVTRFPGAPRSVHSLARMSRRLESAAALNPPVASS